MMLKYSQAQYLLSERHFLASLYATQSQPQEVYVMAKDCNLFFSKDTN